MVAENHLQTRFHLTATHTTTPTHQHGAQLQDKTHMFKSCVTGTFSRFLLSQRPKCLTDFAVCFSDSCPTWRRVGNRVQRRRRTTTLHMNTSVACRARLTDGRRVQFPLSIRESPSFARLWRQLGRDGGGVNVCKMLSEVEAFHKIGLFTHEVLVSASCGPWLERRVVFPISPWAGTRSSAHVGWPRVGDTRRLPAMLHCRRRGGPQLPHQDSRCCLGDSRPRLCLVASRRRSSTSLYQCLRNWHWSGVRCRGGPLARVSS